MRRRPELDRRVDESNAAARSRSRQTGTGRLIADDGTSAAGVDKADDLRVGGRIETVNLASSYGLVVIIDVKVVVLSLVLSRRAQDHVYSIPAEVKRSL